MNRLPSAGFMITPAIPARGGYGGGEGGTYMEGGGVSLLFISAAVVFISLFK